METTADAKETLRKFFADHAETELTKGDKRSTRMHMEQAIQRVMEVAQKAFDDRLAQMELHHDGPMESIPQGQRPQSSHPEH